MRVMELKSMDKIVNTFRKVSYKKVLFCLFVGLYIFSMFMALLMKDHANNEWVRTICKEYVYGPKNMIALVVNKVSPNTMKINSAFFPQAAPIEEPWAEKRIREVLERYKQQSEIDSKLKAEYESGEYSLDDPFVVVNPYGISPLTALVMFDTDEDVQVAVKVIGHQVEEDIGLSTGGGQHYSKKHIVPIYGMYADEENTVELICRDHNGNTTTKTLKIRTESLSDMLQKVNLQVVYSDIAKVNPGLNFAHGSIESTGVKWAFDINGNIRWHFTDLGQLGGTNYNDGKNVYRSIGADSNGGCLLVKESYIGRIESMYYLPQGIHHDVHLTKNDTILVTSSNAGSYGDLLVEIDSKSGKILNESDYRTLLPRARDVGLYRGLGDGVSDWAHVNAIVDYGQDYISSSNLQSAVFCHGKAGNIKWILSDPSEYTTYWKQYLLTPVGDNFEYPYNQHAVEVLPDLDGNPDTVDILLFDNGTSRNEMNQELQKAIKLGDAIEPPLYSRLVQYRINEKDMTVEQIWQYGKERPEIFAEFRGDADLLDNGNILGTFVQERTEATRKKNRPYYYENTVYVEVDRSGEVIWECYGSSKLASNKYADYRLCRTNIYNPSVDYSHLLDESHNFVPEEIMKKYGY